MNIKLIIIALCLAFVTIFGENSRLLQSSIDIPLECGKNTCTKGQYCCNRSCSQCTPVGWQCTQQVCDEHQ